MKEQESRSTQRNNLTQKTANDTLGREGAIFMAEAGGLGPESQVSRNNITSMGRVVDSVPQATTEENPITEAILTHSEKDISNPSLQNFAKDFEERMRAKPINAWTDKELEKEYLQWHSFATELAQKIIDSSQRDQVAMQAQPYRELIIQELDRRSPGKARELFLKAIENDGLTALERGTIGAASVDIDGSIYKDPRLQAIVLETKNKIRSQGEGKPLDDYFIRTQEQRIRSLVDQQLVDSFEAALLLDTFDKWLPESERQARVDAGKERFGFYLQAKDIEMLGNGEEAIMWLDEKFDLLFQIAQQGQELSSPVVEGMQAVVTEGMRYLQHYNKDILDRFQTLFTVRFNLIQTRTLIGYRAIGEIKSAAYRLQAHGLFYGLCLEEGKVGEMYNRIHELTEDLRLSDPDHHLKPEKLNQLQDKLINEQINLAKKGIGSFSRPERGELTVEQMTKLKADVTRSVRTAYDIFVCSQRLAVVTARGRHLTGAEAYFSDPASGPLNVYNIEDLLWAKFGIGGEQLQKYLRKIKIDMANDSLGDKKNTLTEEKKVDLGQRLFRDLYAVPDLFSSSWRIMGILDSLEERFAPKFAADIMKNKPNLTKEQAWKEARERVNDFALFMRLKSPKYMEEVHDNDGNVIKNKDGTVRREKESSSQGRREIWKKIRQYRPEEIIRLFHERAPEELSKLYSSTAFKEAGITDYITLKEKYGPVLRAIREKGFNRELPTQLDMTKLNSDEYKEYRQLIVNQFGEDGVRKVINMFKRMQDFIEDGRIKDLIKDEKFADIYTRTLVVDDVLLNMLEKEEQNVGENGEVHSVVPISKKFSADQGGDFYVRSWNDTENAIEAAKALLAFLQDAPSDLQHKAEHAELFADKTSQYNGEGGRAKCIRFTLGTHLILSKMPIILDSLGIKKLPFRKAMSEIEKIYGVVAQPLNKDELRYALDEQRRNLKARMEEMTSEEQGFSEEQKAELLKKHKDEFDKYYRELEQELDVETGINGGLVKRRAISLLIALIGFVIVESIMVPAEATKEAIK